MKNLGYMLLGALLATLVAHAETISLSTQSSFINTLNVTANPVTVTAATGIVCVNKTSGSATTVPLPTPTQGRILIVKDCKGDSSSNIITIQGTVDGTVNPTIQASLGTYRLFADGTTWHQWQ